MARKKISEALDDPAVAAATAQAAIDDAPADDTLEDSTVDSTVETQDDVTTEGTEETQAATQQPTVQPTAPAQPSWREQLGPEYAGLDDTTAIQRIQQQVAAAQQAQQHVQQWQYRAAQLEAQQNLQAQQQQQAIAAQQAQQVEAAKKKWEAPEFDPAWLSLLNEDGTPKNGVDPMLPGKIRAYAAHRESVMNRLATDPDTFLQERFEATLAAKVEERIRAALAQQQQVQFVENFERQYEQYIYQPGTKNYTPIGVEIVQRAKAFTDQGMPPQMALQTATDLVRGQLALQQLTATNGQQSASAAAQATNDQKKKELLAKGAVQRPNRSGTFPRSETRDTAPAQNRRLSFSEMARDGFKEAGLWEEPVLAQ